jgi:hypothetical protein
MITRGLAVLLVVCGSLLLLPAGSADAAHRVGGYDVACYSPPSSGYNGQRVAVEGVGSDVPRNALIAARAHVSSSPSCNKTNGVRVVRVQIDRLALLNGASVLTERDALNNGTADITAQTAGVANLACSAGLRVYVSFSARFADGTVGYGSNYGPYFHRC